MKISFKLLMCLSILLAFSSCEKEFERTTFNPSDANDTFLSFSSANTTAFPVNVDESDILEIVIQTSTLSSNDRTFTVLLDEELTNANESNFELPSTVTIPADSYFGTIGVNIIDNEFLTGEAKTIAISLGGVDNVFMDSNLFSVNIFEVCPVDENFFVGTYLMEQVSDLVDGPTLSTGTIVEVQINEDDETGLSRMFSTQHYPDYCPDFTPFIVNLFCNEFIVPVQNSLCFCNSGDSWFGPAETPDTYSITEGDDELFISFADDVQADCGATVVTRYKFTKQ